MFEYYSFDLKLQIEAAYYLKLEVLNVLKRDLIIEILIFKTCKDVKF